MCANTDTGKVSRSNPRTANSFTHGISTAIVECLAQTVCTPNTVNGVEIKRKKPKRGDILQQPCNTQNTQIGFPLNKSQMPHLRNAKCCHGAFSPCIHNHKGLNPISHCVVTSLCLPFFPPSPPRSPSSESLNKIQGQAEISKRYVTKKLCGLFKLRKMPSGQENK